MFGVFLVIGVKYAAVTFFQVSGIAVDIVFVGVQLDERNADVGAVVGNTLAVGEEIVEYEAMFQCADAFTNTVDVIGLHRIAEIIGQLLQRLDAVCDCKVAVHEGSYGKAHNFRRSTAQKGDFGKTFRREGNAFVMDFFGTFRNVDRVVADAFKVRDGVQIFRDFLVLMLVHFTPHELD